MLPLRVLGAARADQAQRSGAGFSTSYTAPGGIKTAHRAVTSYANPLMRQTPSPAAT